MEYQKTLVVALNGNSGIGTKWRNGNSGIGTKWSTQKHQSHSCCDSEKPCQPVFSLFMQMYYFTYLIPVPHLKAFPAFVTHSSAPHTPLFLPAPCLD
jgi:hypothetical protein